MTSLTGVVSGSVTRTTWAAGRVAEQLEDLVGLDAHRSAAHGVVQACRRRQERDRMAGRRSVDDDDVPFAAALELLDLAQDDDVVDPGAAVATTSMTPEVERRLATRPKP